MRRRSFLKFLPALGALPLIGKLAPAAPVVPLVMRHSDKGAGYGFGFGGFAPASHRDPAYKYLRAGAAIAQGQLLATNSLFTGVIPATSYNQMIAGLSMHSALEGEMVKVLVRGQAEMPIGRTGKVRVTADFRRS